MTKVYEAMILSRDHAPEATKQFLDDYNFSAVVSTSESLVSAPIPINIDISSPDSYQHSEENIQVHPTVAVAEAIACSVDNLTESLDHNSPSELSPDPLNLEDLGDSPYTVEPLASESIENPGAVTSSAPAVDAGVQIAADKSEPATCYLPSQYRTEFTQLCEIVLRTAEKQTLQVIVVCGIEPNDNADFIVENLSLALAEKENLKIGKFNLTAPENPGLQPIGNDHYRIRLHQTHIKNMQEVSPLHGPIPLTRLFAECDVEQLIEMLRQRFDYILLNTDAVNSVSEVAKLAALTDGVILVAQKENMYGPVMDFARSKLKEAGAKILGAVLNRSRRPDQFQRVA